jgi:CRP-like cAMP-binding protein
MQMIQFNSPNDLRELLLSGRRHKLSKKQILQSTEDRQVMNLVKSGYIKRYLIANDGTLGIQVVYGPGNIFPVTLALKALFNQEVYSKEIFYYEAMGDAEVYTIDISTLVKAVDDNPLIYRDLLEETGKRLNSTLQGLENLTLKSSYKRVAHQLAYFASRFGEKTDKGLRINVALTHQDLANILSLTRETVSTCMSDLRERGLISSDKQKIIVTNPKKLEKLAYS